MSGNNNDSTEPSAGLSVEKDLERNRDLKALLDVMREVVFYFDRWGLVKQGNARANAWLSTVDIIGKSFIELAPAWDDAAERQRELMQVIRSGIPVWGSRERAFEDGFERWYSVDKIPTRHDSGEVSGVMLVVGDITEHVLRERALEESEARYKAFIANSVDAIWRFDLCPPVDTALDIEEQIDQILQRAVMSECNENLAQFYGVEDSQDLIGLPLELSGSLSLREDVYQFVEKGYASTNKEFSRIKRDGKRIFLQSNAIGIVENGYLMRAWGTTRDVTDHRMYLDKLEYLANHDSLTALPNRALLYRKVERYLEQKMPEEKMALMLIDLDRFKEINDTLGHLAGDKVLKQLGPRLEAELGGSSGVVARLGGDEFAIFLPDIASQSQATTVARRLLDSICLVFDLEGYRTEISASIGIALCPEQGDDISTLMRFADVAMYHAKSNLLGVSVYDADQDPHSPKRLSLMGDLGRAIREDELTLYFQPKINLSSDQVYEFEALIRWNHPEMGFVPPNEFVPIAEMSNLIYPMTVWVLESSIRQCKHWLDQGLSVKVAINLSVRNLMDDRIVSELKRLLGKYNFPGGSLELEITESAIMSDRSRAQTALERIHALGVRLSIDDFGTGYSSLTYLKRLPVQTLKIDSSFILSMLEVEQDEIIVKSTINLAHNLGLKVVAEGVESNEVYKKLSALGCDGAQGFFMAKPMPAEDIASWMGESGWATGRYVVNGEPIALEGTPAAPEKS